MDPSTVRKPVFSSYKEKLLSPGGLGFLVGHAEADDIVSGWKGFFAKKNAESEAGVGENEDGVSVEDVGDEPCSKYPVLSVTSDQYSEWCRPWMNSLIIKLLGSSVPKHVLIDRVRRMWKPQQPLKVVPLSNEYYIVSFSSKEDRDYAFSEGPWMIDDHYLLVQRWRPNFIPWKADCQRRVAVWVRIPDLPMEFCTVESLGMIGNMIGKIIKIDRSTSIYDKGGFARICVEIDLQKPLLPAFTVFGEDKQLVYEGLHMVCFSCGLYGHEKEVCPHRKQEEGEPVCRDDVGSNEGRYEQNMGGQEGTSTTADMLGNKENCSGEQGQEDGPHSQERTTTFGMKAALENNGVLKQRVKNVSGKRSSEDSEGSKRTGMGGQTVVTTAMEFGLGMTGLAPATVHGVARERVHLGPQMILRRDFRKGYQNRAGQSGGTKGVTSGGPEKLQGVMTREELGGVIGHNLGKPKLVAKSGGAVLATPKLKEEWVMVGSKRRKESQVKRFGKDVRNGSGRIKVNKKEEGSRGTHKVPLNNSFSSLLSQAHVKSDLPLHDSMHSDVIIGAQPRSDFQKEKGPLDIIFGAERVEAAVMTDETMGVGVKTDVMNDELVHWVFPSIHLLRLKDIVVGYGVFGRMNQ
ncbi:hypothetical protein K1719_042334 [Acacia pycnantha]|nr:hypothetical protein K1719_042334 [Acacia pycnantha]